MKHFLKDLKKILDELAASYRHVTPMNSFKRKNASPEDAFARKAIQSQLYVLKALYRAGQAMAQQAYQTNPPAGTGVIRYLLAYNRFWWSLYLAQHLTPSADVPRPIGRVGPLALDNYVNSIDILSVPILKPCLSKAVVDWESTTIGAMVSELEALAKERQKKELEAVTRVNSATAKFMGSLTKDQWELFDAVWHAQCALTEKNSSPKAIVTFNYAEISSNFRNG